MMKKILEFLSGKKTYIVGIGMFLVAGLHAVKDMIPLLSAIPDDYWQAAMDFLKTGGLGLAAIFLRAGINK
jgi:hypothetical protein